MNRDLNKEAAGEHFALKYLFLSIRKDLNRPLKLLLALDLAPNSIKYVFRLKHN
jgi:hypothetical protein